MNPIRLVTVVGLALPTLAVPALAQSLNIDMDRTVSPGNGAPASTFGAAMAQTGTWNSVLTGMTGPQALMGLNGLSSGVTISRAGTSSSGGASAGGSADYSRLMSDYSATYQEQSPIDFRLNGLDEGLYLLTVYAFLPGDQGWYTDTFGIQTYYQSHVFAYVGNVSYSGGTTTGPLPTAGTFARGVTHITFPIKVGPGAPEVKVVSSAAQNNINHYRAAMNGIQVVKYPAARLYVDRNAVASANTGVSWANAFTDLQEALRVARVADGAITEIWVADGTYTPVSGLNINRTASFELPDGVKVYGGFAGNETQLAQRNPAANPTYLSGGIGLPGLADNSYHVVVAKNCGYATLLDGFTISSGNANGASGNQMHGGAMWIENSQLTVENCGFVGNQGWRGGAVAVTNSIPRFQGCSFFNNTAEQVGGGLILLAGGQARVVSCDFRHNHATVNYGGAIANYGGTNLWAFNCRFLSNDANWGGGAIYCYSGSTVVANGLFTGNRGEHDRGGAIHAFGANTSLFVYNSTIWNNHAYQCGGVTAFWDAKAYLRNTIVWGNTDNDPATATEAEQVRREPGGNAILSLQSSVVQGWSGLLGGSGNLGLNPDFVDPDGPDNIAGTLDDNLRLRGSSPCIDRGDNAGLPSDAADLDRDNNLIEPLPLDLDRKPRRLDVAAVPDLGLGAAPIVDIGAYETDEPCWADCDSGTGPGTLDIFDFLCFQNRFDSGNPYACNCDVGTGQGVCDIFDFLCFQNAFAAGCP